MSRRRELTELAIGLAACAALWAAVRLWVAPAIVGAFLSVPSRHAPAGGAVWGNLIADGIGILAAWWRLRIQGIRHRDEARAQAERLHREREEAAERRHREQLTIQEQHHQAVHRRLDEHAQALATVKETSKPVEVQLEFHGADKALADALRKVIRLRGDGPAGAGVRI